MNVDVSARTAQFAAALLGEAEVPGGLAFPVQLPRAQLDYTLDSLNALQQYLERVRPFANALDTQVYQNTLLAAGSYLGEVIRREVLPEATWAMPAGGGMPVLSVAGGTLTPVAQIQLVLSGAAGEDLPKFAADQFSFTGAVAAEEAAAEDEFGFDFLDELESSPAEETASEDLGLGAEADDVAALWEDEPAVDQPESKPANSDEFDIWDDETTPPAADVWTDEEPPAADAETGPAEDEFAFPWEEPTGDATESLDLAGAVGEQITAFDEDLLGLTSDADDEFDFSSGPVADMAADEIAHVEDEVATPAADEELEFGTSSEWDDEDDIILDVEIIDEDEEETEPWSAEPASLMADVSDPSSNQSQVAGDEGEIDLWASAEPAAETAEPSAAATDEDWMDFTSPEEAPAEFDAFESEADTAGMPSPPLPFAPPIVPQAETDQFSFESASADEQELPTVESESQELAEFGEGEDFGFDFESEEPSEATAMWSPAEAEPAEAVGPLEDTAREEAALDEEFFGELTEEEMADDDLLLGFGPPAFDAGVEAELPGEEPLEELAAAPGFDPLVEPAETTQDWDPIAEEPVGEFDSVEASAVAAEPTAMPTVLPAGPAKAPEAWDFADFFATPGSPAPPLPVSSLPAAAADAGGSWFQEFEFPATSETPVEEDLEAEESEELAEFSDDEFGSDDVAGEGDFDLDEFLPTEEAVADPIEGVEAADPWPADTAETVEPAEAFAEVDADDFDFNMEGLPAETSEMADLLEFDQTEDADEPVLGLPNEDSTIIEEGSPEFAALMGDELEPEPAMEEQPLAHELLAEAEETKSETEAEWDFASPTETEAGAEDSFDFDFAGGEAAPTAAFDFAAEAPGVEEPAEPELQAGDEFSFADEVATPTAAEEPVESLPVESITEAAAKEEVADQVSPAAASDEFDFGFAAEEPAAADDFAFDFAEEEPAAEEPAAEEPADVEPAEVEAAAESQAGAEEVSEFVDLSAETETTGETADEFDVNFTAEEAPAAAEKEAATADADEVELTAEAPAEETDAEMFDFGDEATEESSLAASQLFETASEEITSDAILEEAAVASEEESEWDFAAVEEQFTAEEEVAEELAHEELAENEFATAELGTEAFAAADFAAEDFAADELTDEVEESLPPALVAQQAQIEQHLAAASAGDAQAQFELGRLYEEGLFAEDNLPEAVRRYQEAADQGHPAAMARLGHLFYLGQGVAQNWTKGVQLYLKAAKTGEPLAQSNLGMCLEHGKGVQRDMEKALRCYYAGANAGSAACQTNLALCYLRGRGVKQQVRVAARWLQKAAEQDYGPALLLLAACYEGGVGVDKSSTEAESLYRRAADAGYAFPEGKWAIRTKHGQATAADAVDPIWWLRLAADADEPWAQHNMGFCYRTGHGVRESASKTFHWFQTAAKADFAPAQYELGRCFEMATGTPKDMARAAKWYTRAATAGYAPAKARLALLYDCGLGVERDAALAAKWSGK